jgi:hypothetical protein
MELQALLASYGKTTMSWIDSSTGLVTDSKTISAEDIVGVSWGPKSTEF